MPILKAQKGETLKNLWKDTKKDFHKQYVPEGMSKEDYARLQGATQGSGALSKIGAAPDAMARGLQYLTGKVTGLLKRPTAIKAFNPSGPTEVVPGGVHYPVGSRETADMIKREMAWLNDPEYVRRKAAATGMSYRDIIAEKRLIMEQFMNTRYRSYNLDNPIAKGAYTSASGTNPPRVELWKADSPQSAINTLSHEIKHAGSETALGNDAIYYKKYPAVKFRNAEWIGEWANKPYEQQTVSKRIMDYIEETQGVKRGQQLDDAHIIRMANDLNAQILANKSHNSDIMHMLTQFNKQYGPGWIPYLTKAVNKAYVIPAAAVAGSAVAKQKNK